MASETPSSAGNSPLSGLFEDPRLLLQRLDLSSGFADLVEMDPVGYRNSSFLDERAKCLKKKGLRVPIADLNVLVEKEQPPQRPANYLFHMGHAGAGLVSRLLDTLPGHFGVRDPQPMEALAVCRRQLPSDQAPVTAEVWQRCVTLVDRMTARTYDSQTRAVIKPAAFADFLIPTWIENHPENRAIFVYVSAETYLAEVVRPHWRPRVVEFARRFLIDDHEQLTGERLDPETMNEGEFCALHWLVLATRFDLVMGHPEFADRCRRMNFDDFLTDRIRYLGEVSGFFGRPVDAVRLHRAISHPVNRLHARKPDSPYTDEDRSQMLNTSLRDHARLISDGLLWIETQMKRHPAMERAAAWYERVKR